MSILTNLRIGSNLYIWSMDPVCTIFLEILTALQMSCNNCEVLLKTSLAAFALGCSVNTLKRKRDTHGGFLVAGVDYFLGCSSSSSILWNVTNIREKFHKHGLAARKNANTDFKDDS